MIGIKWPSIRADSWAVTRITENEEPRKRAAGEPLRGLHAPTLVATGCLVAAWAGFAAGGPARTAALIALVFGLAMLGTGATLFGRQRSNAELSAISSQLDRARRHTETLELHFGVLTAELGNVKQDLERSEAENHRRSEYVLMMNRELRAPLTGVVTGSRILGQSLSLTMDERDLLENVIADGERLEAVLSQMLFVARSENPELAANPTVQSLGHVVDRIRRIHRTIRTSMTEGIGLAPIDVNTDTTTLSQIVSTLVDNAYNHGARRVEVVVTNSIPKKTHHQVGELPETPVYVAVVDDGPGMDPTFVQRAFEPFTKRPDSQGAGLGLPMVAMMIESIGASLSVVTSRKGTVMAIGLPAQVRIAA